MSKKKVQRITLPAAPQPIHRVKGEQLRVAAYCRVSTDSKEQQLSFEIQRSYYADWIEATPDWEMAGIYADEGITGTNVRKRKGFQQMVRDCEHRKIDLIVTKSISRFSRNTLECLQYIRYLQSLGVQLLFEKEKIDTRCAFSEMLLTILAAFAQEESRNISENVKWGVRKRFEEGKDRWVSVYGYTNDGDKTYVVVPEEAAVVQKIYDMYEHGERVSDIMGFLHENHIPTPKGMEKWRDTAVYSILKNEKYAGDIILQKRYTIDHITHQEVKNDGSIIPAFYVRDHHTPLISRQTERRVKEIRSMRTQTPINGERGPGTGSTRTYPFGEMLKCPLCGNTLVRRKLNIQDCEPGWCCDQGYHTYSHFIFRDWAIHKAVLNAYNHLSMNEICKLSGKKKTEAIRMMQKTKAEHPAFTRVDYYWLDDLVERIEISPHEVIEQRRDREDDTVTVYWKCGLVSTVFSEIRRKKDHPYHVANLYNAFLERKGFLTEEEAV